MLCSNGSLIIFLQCIVVALSACTFPSAFVNTTWYDSDKGDLNFTDSQMSGWPITGGGQTISLWECFYQKTYSSHVIVIYKGASSIRYLDGSFRFFICMNLTEVTSSSYYYYQMSPEQSRLGEERLTAMVEASVSSIVMVDAELTLCENDLTLVPSVNEYHVLVKSVKEIEATQLCDSSFYGRYWYNISEDGVTWSCDNSSYWDVCSDRQYMVFNYSMSNCQSLMIASSDLGEVRCLVSISSRTNVLQTVTTTGNTTNNFTCILSRLDEETDQVYATMSPGSCTKTQTTDSLPILADGISTVGKIIHLTPYPQGLCPITYDSSESTVPVSVIVGGVLGALALLATTAILILLCMWCCKAKPTEHKDENEAKRSRRCQATKCFPSSKCLPNCLILGKKTRGKDKLKGDADVVLETLPHAISGKAPILPRALENPPRETSIKKDMTLRKDLLIFPQAKSTDFKLSLPPQSGRAKTLSSTTGLFINRAEQSHPPPTFKKPESFYNTNIATAPSPIPEERNTTLFRNRQSVQVNPSNSPSDNSVSKPLKRQSSITSLGDNDNSAFTKLPAALEPEPSRQYRDTSTRFSGSSGKESDPGKVNVPLTARPIVISPETCISVNMKSQIEEQSVNSNNDTSQSINLDQSESQNKVFMSLPLTEANVAKQSDDIMVINTPEGTFDSALRSPLTNMMTNDDVSLPVSRQDSDSNIINATETA